MADIHVLDGNGRGGWNVIADFAVPADWRLNGILAPYI